MFVLIKCLKSSFVLMDLVSPQSEPWYRTVLVWFRNTLDHSEGRTKKYYKNAENFPLLLQTLPAIQQSIQTKSLTLFLNYQSSVLLFQLQCDSLYHGRFILLRWTLCPGSKTLGRKRLLDGEVNLFSLDVRGFQLLQSTLTTAINLVCSCYEYFCSKQGWHQTVDIP